VKLRQFGAAMTEKGFERYTNNGTWYRGVALIDNGAANGTTEPYGT
jgi:hypothetical protein